MVEKLHTPDDDDATRIKSAGANNKVQSSTTVSLTPTANEPTQGGYDGAGVLADIQLEIGDIIKDTFELVAVLGEGGMGTVYKALNKVWQEVEARDPYVAIKVLKPELSANKQLVRSLYSDFDRTKMLANCPNIIKVHGFDRDGPHVYMTMEYLAGKTLGEYLHHEPMNLAQAWFIIEGIGHALAYAHENNIVHRDIKPGNVIITDTGIVKVLDFGIASKINENEGDETKFGGHELGALTVAYAAPEMQRDYPPDARDDIYAFACVIYEILTGKQFYKQKIPKAAPIKGLNSRQMEILNKSLAFEREQRTANIHELLDKLRPVKVPWLTYLGMGGGALIIAGLGFWGIKELTTSTGVKQAAIPQAVQQVPVVVQTAPVVASPPVPVTEPTAATAAAPPVDSESGYRSTSSDGLIQLQTSKPDYNNGEPFQLSYTLAQPRYVRVIDRDVNGQITTLHPNPRQPDKLLPANQVHLFPPKGFSVPVKGPAGISVVTLVASARPFPKTIVLLNDDGSISEQVLSGSYSWTQVRYALHQ